MSKATFVAAIAVAFCTMAIVLVATPLNTPLAAEELDLQCGTHVTPAERDALLAKYRDEPTIAVPPPIGPNCVPIAVHVVRRANGTGAIPQSQLDQGLIDLNTHELYVNTGIQFYYLPGIDFIDDDNFYSGITTQLEADALRGINVVANAINIYFVSQASIGGFSLCGLSSFTTSAVQGILMINGCTGVASNPSTYPHELGHYFDLFHTHETAFGNELVNGSNCGTAGDLLCDTPADPGLSGLVTNACVYTGNATDSNGDTYVPDPLQLMSFSVKICRTDVTPNGETRALSTLLIDRPELLNCEPVADCGGPYLAECDTPPPGTTAVQLDGTASNDPEGAPLTYSWSGASFDDATSATPTGQFPLGTTQVTLTVSDGLGENTCMVDVVVVDTTPPAVACPPGIVLECTDHCGGGGVPASSPIIVAWLALFFGVDVCDNVLTLSNDAPACFPLGTTTVTFTATDDSGNSAECSADVTVVDTTPPVFDVCELNRNVLWPPNHKLVDICATIEVSDICDPNPTFVMTSAVSDEPDNGKGDGNTTGDIQVDLGTPDVKFQLRSERQGGGDGRKYTIVYTATDQSGNEATCTLCVTVPHDQSGNALASVGFISDGTAFDQSEQRFAIVIPSVPGLVVVQEEFDATALDPQHVYVGNTGGVLRPVATVEIDVTGDGMDDLGLFYLIEEGNAFLATATGNPDDNDFQINRSQGDGPVGLHYRGEDGTDYLVSNIFRLGEPVSLLPTVPPLGTDKDEKSGDLPRMTELSGIYPNPFNPTTTIAFTLVAAEHVKLDVFDARGTRVRQLRNEDMPGGAYEIEWDGRDHAGQPVSSGIYFVRLIAGDYQMTKKAVMLK